MRGTLNKMKTRLESVVQYELAVGEQRLALNPLIGRPITLSHTGQIFCDPLLARRREIDSIP